MAAPLWVKLVRAVKVTLDAVLAGQNKEIGWTKSFQNVPEFVPATWADWLTSGGKKHEGDKSWKFFKEGYVFDVYVGQKDGYGKLFYSAKSYRSLRKNEDPHYLHLLVSENDSKASVDCAITLA